MRRQLAVVAAVACVAVCILASLRLGGRDEARSLEQGSANRAPGRSRQLYEGFGDADISAVVICVPGRNRLDQFRAKYALEVGFDVVDGVDGTKLDMRELVRARTLDAEAGSKLTVGMVGCFLSHLMVFRLALGLRPSRPLLVFEDDCVVQGVSKPDLMRRLSTLPPGWHLYIAGVVHTRFEADQVPGRQDGLVKVRAWCGTHAYVLSPEGARYLARPAALRSLLPIVEQVDWVLSDLASRGLQVYMHPGLPNFGAASEFSYVQVGDKALA